MTNQSSVPNEPTEADEAERIAEWVVGQILPVQPEPVREQRIRSRLMARVAESARQHRSFQTRRREDGVWQTRASGVAARHLHDEAGVGMSMLQFNGNATLDPGPAVCAEEWLVLSGHLSIGGEELGTGDYIFVPSGDQRGSIRALDGARAYLRTSAAGAAFVDLSGRRLVRAADPDGWQPFCPGVAARMLQSASHEGAEHVSMVLRFDPGASAAQHAHPAGEECVLIEGEVFLGDMMLREGEFQWAASGSRHGTVRSESGCLLFFHGAIDPELQAGT